MSVTDPIGDMLTRIRNAQACGVREVEIPYSRMKDEIARVLREEGYIRSYFVEGEGVDKALRVGLKYHSGREPSIRGLRRISRPGLRRYVRCEKLPRVQAGMGTVVLSTSRGIMTDREARQQQVGGEDLFHVW